MVIERGNVYWVDLGAEGEADHRPARRRPVLVIQDDAYNRSRIGTVVVAAVTANLNAAGMPGNVLLPSADSGLPRDSVVDVTAMLTLNRFELEQPAAGAVSAAAMARVDDGLRQLLGLRA